jgi:hypothetical protein
MASALFLDSAQRLFVHPGATAGALHLFAHFAPDR